MLVKVIAIDLYKEDKKIDTVYFRSEKNAREFKNNPPPFPVEMKSMREEMVSEDLYRALRKHDWIHSSDWSEYKNINSFETFKKNKPKDYLGGDNMYNSSGIVIQRCNQYEKTFVSKIQDSLLENKKFKVFQDILEKREISVVFRKDSSGKIEDVVSYYRGDEEIWLYRGVIPVVKFFNITGKIEDKSITLNIDFLEL